MVVVVADPSTRAEFPATVKIGVLIVHECPLFRVGLRSLLEQHSDFHVVGEAIHLEEVLSLAREQRPVVLLDGGLTSTDPLDLVRQLRQVGVQGIMVFAPTAADEETLFHFLRYGATAYEDHYICGEELLEKVRRMSLGEYLVTSDVLFAQVARRERLARIRQDAFLPLRWGTARSLRRLPYFPSRNGRYLSKLPLDGRMHRQLRHFGSVPTR